MNTISAGLLMTFGFAAATPLASAEEFNLDRKFTVTPGGHLTVSADGGDVTVTGAEGEHVTVNVRAKGPQRMLDQMVISAEQSGDDISVIAKETRDHMGWLDWLRSRGDLAVQITVIVPRRYQVDIGTSGGDLAVRHVEGDITGRTSGGDVRVADLRGIVRMKTSGGDVTVDTVKGNVETETSGGDIWARSITGDFDAHTSGGDVQAEAISGAVRLRSSGGEIVARHINGSITARTSGGDVRLDEIDGAIQARTSGGSVRASLVGANRGISVSTSGSEILLRLPESVTATVDAAAGGGRIRSELPISATLTGESRINGTINGGGEPIYARTSGSNITMQARR